MKIEVDFDTKEMSEARLLEWCFVLWNQLPGNGKKDARKHFAARFELAGLSKTQQYLSKVLDGTTHLGDEGWAIVIHDADGANHNRIAAALRLRWLARCDKSARNNSQPKS